MEKTEKELSAGIERLITGDIAKLFPNPADAAKVRELCQKIRVKTAYNERVAAFKAISATLGSDLLASVKKAMFPLILMLLVFTGQSRAQEAPITAIDLNAPLADARIGLAWGGAGEQLGIAYVPLMYWVGAEGQEYATFNLGATDKLSTGKAGYLVSAGPRLDVLFRKIAGSKFSQRHLRFALLPPLQININMVTSDFRVYTPHLSICTRFGGK
jgi:hypothetical protein